MRYDSVRCRHRRIFHAETAFPCKYSIRSQRRRRAVGPLHPRDSRPPREGRRTHPHRRRSLLPSPRSSTLQSRGRMLGFLRLHGPVAQPGERRPRMAEVTSSSLVGSTLIGCLDKRKTPCKGKDRSCLLDLTTPTITPTGLSEGIHDTVVVWPLPSMNVFQPIGGRFLLPTQRLLESGSSGFHTPVSESMRPIPNVTPL